MEERGKLALEIYTQKVGETPIPTTGVNSAVSVNMNKGQFYGWKRVVAAVVFNQPGHELLLRQDWGEERTCREDFPKGKTFFIMREQDEGSAHGRPKKPTKGECTVQSNDEHNEVSPVKEETKHCSESTTKGNSPKLLETSRGKKGTAMSGPDQENSAANYSSQRESKQQIPDSTEAELPVGTQDLAATDPLAQEVLNVAMANTTEFCDASTQTVRPEGDVEKIDTSTSMASIKENVDVGTQTQSSTGEAADEQEIRGTEAEIPMGTSGSQRGVEDETGGQEDTVTDAGLPVGTDEPQTADLTVIPQPVQMKTSGDDHSMEGDGYGKWGPVDLNDIREFTGYAYGKANNQSCDRTAANQRARELLKNPDQINSSSVTEVLNKWKFARNTWRKNVRGEGQEYIYI